jgi:hypothetical protein
LSKKNRLPFRPFFQIPTINKDKKKKKISKKY